MTQPAKHITILLLTVFFICNFCYAQKDTTKISHDIMKVTRKISRFKTVDRGPVGISGKLTKQFNSFFFLINQATDKELVELTNYKSANVRACAFDGLVIKGYNGVRQILDKHIGDTPIINIRDGCMSSKEHINFYFLELLTPNVMTKTSITN